MRLVNRTQCLNAILSLGHLLNPTWVTLDSTVVLWSLPTRASCSQKKKANGEVLSERILSFDTDTIRILKSKRKKYFNFDILKFVLGS